MLKTALSIYLLLCINNDALYQYNILAQYSINNILIIHDDIIIYDDIIY